MFLFSPVGLLSHGMCSAEPRLVLRKSSYHVFCSSSVSRPGTGMLVFSAVFSITLYLSHLDRFQAGSCPLLPSRVCGWARRMQTLEGMIREDGKGIVGGIEMEGMMWRWTESRKKGDPTGKVIRPARSPSSLFRPASPRSRRGCRSSRGTSACDAVKGYESVWDTGVSGLDIGDSRDVRMGHHSTSITLHLALAGHQQHQF